MPIFLPQWRFFRTALNKIGHETLKQPLILESYLFLRIGFEVSEDLKWFFCSFVNNWIVALGSKIIETETKLSFSVQKLQIHFADKTAIWELSIFITNLFFQ